MELELEEVNCVLCNMNDYVELSRQGNKREYGVRKCKGCGFVYLSPRPTAASIHKIYDEDYYQTGETGYFDYANTYYRFEKVYLKFFQTREKLVRRFKQPGKLLEIGCAHGFHLNYLKNQGWDVVGIDVSPVSSRYAKEKLHLEVSTGNLRDQGFNDDSFDVVLLIDVLEHLHDPVGELVEIKRVLKPGGIILVQVPYELFHWEEYAEAIIRGMKPGSITPDALPAHLYFFSPRTLKQFLQKCGYKVLHRASGNYGAVRSKVDPPDLNNGSIPARLVKKIYFKWGLQKLLYSIAKTVKQGNGIIYIAQPFS